MLKSTKDFTFFCLYYKIFSISLIGLLHMNELDEHLVIDRQKIKNAIRLQMPVEVTSYTLPRNMEVYVREVLTAFLEECHQDHLKEYLNFCLGELLTNAKKANTKRIYFKSKNLDINNPDDYAKGMETFKSDTLDNINYYLELQKKAGLYIKLVLRLDVDEIIVEIRNNSILTKNEESRIQQKLSSVQQYKSMEEVLNKVLDQTEGAGLGIIIIILMLQKVGLSKENYQVFTTDTETVTRMILPCNKDIYDGASVISSEFINLQNSLPISRVKFDEINKLVNESVIDRNKVYDVITKSSTLSILAAKESIGKGNKDIKLMAILQSLSDDDLRYIYSENNQYIKIIDDENIIEQYEIHSSNTAKIAYNLAKNPNNIEEALDPDLLYTLALWNNLGYLMLGTMSDEQEKKIQEISNGYPQLDNQIIDIFKSGITSGLLLFEFAKKINFPEEIAGLLVGWNCIRFAPKFCHNNLYVIYLAETMSYYSEGLIDFYQIDKEILKKFNIETEKQFIYVKDQILNSQ